MIDLSELVNLDMIMSVQPMRRQTGEVFIIRMASRLPIRKLHRSFWRGKKMVYYKAIP